MPARYERWYRWSLHDMCLQTLPQMHDMCLQTTDGRRMTCGYRRYMHRWSAHDMCASLRTCAYRPYILSLSTCIHEYTTSKYLCGKCIPDRTHGKCIPRLPPPHLDMCNVHTVVRRHISRHMSTYLDICLPRRHLDMCNVHTTTTYTHARAASAQSVTLPLAIFP